MAFEKISIDPGYGFNKHSELVVGRVVNVVLSQYTDDKETKNPEYNSPSDIGKIMYVPLFRNKQVSIGESAFRPARPAFSFLTQYPVIGELVLIIMGPSGDLNDSANAMQAYYFPCYNIWNSPNHNSFPNISEYLEFIKKVKDNPKYQYIPGTIPEFPKGAYFKERNINKLAPFEGDSIIEGRFGQSIRFGSTSKARKKQNHWSNSGNDGDPIILIRNGQGENTMLIESNPENPRAATLPDQPTIENINKDMSSIYITSTQYIEIEDIKKNKFPISSYRDVRLLKNSPATTNTQNYSGLTRNPVANDSRSAKDNDKDTLS